MRSLRHRGATLPIALMILLLLMIMTIAFTYESRTQSAHNASLKIASYSRIAAENIVRRYVTESDEWVQPNFKAPDSIPFWRMGNTLKEEMDGDYPEYGVLIDSSFSNDAKDGFAESLNAGLMEFHYRLYVANNRDDPAYYYQTGEDDSTIDPSWDTDGKYILTVQTFIREDDVFDVALDFPLTTVSVMVQPTGADYQIFAREAEDEAAGPNNDGSIDTEQAEDLADTIGDFQGN